MWRYHIYWPWNGNWKQQFDSHKMYPSIYLSPQRYGSSLQSRAQVRTGGRNAPRGIPWAYRNAPLRFLLAQERVRKGQSTYFGSTFHHMYTHNAWCSLGMTNINLWDIISRPCSDLNCVLAKTHRLWFVNTYPFHHGYMNWVVMMPTFFTDGT